MKFVAALAAAFSLALPLAPTDAATMPPVQGQNGMVVTAQHLASEVGVEILKRGGNAVDAAVAVGYALAVVNPCCGNIGGGGFMTVHLATGRDVILNFRETAPGAAKPDLFLDPHGNVVPGLSTKGWLAVAVPGTPLGLDTALKRYGTMRREQVLAPAIVLAEHGFIVTQDDADILDFAAKNLADQPNAAAIFMPGGKPIQPGDRLVQRDLAHSLRLLAKDGPDAFYRGPIAAALVKASAAHGGILSAADFAGYKIEEQAPIRCRYRGYDIVAPPPPSSGGVTLCETLAVLEPYPLGDWGFGAAQGVHTLVEALRHSYFDRNATLGDPDFVANPTQRLLSPAHIAEIRAAIKERATPSAALQQPIPHEGGDTTSYAVIDRYGDAVAVTYTINGFFGADVIGGDTGFFLNNEMDDFTSKPSVGNVYGLIQGSANRIEGGKRPLSSMTPTIVLKDGHVFMALGSPGGPRIITSVLETLLNVVDYGMSLTEAVDTPRLHHQWLPDTIYTEPYALSPDTAHALLAMGYTITPQREWSAVEAILAGPPHPPSRAGLHAFADDTTHDQGVRPGFLYGANDARRPSGAAVGY